MPRKPEPGTELGKKWNMYVNEHERLEYMLALAESGHPRAQAAGIRAFMFLYVNDKEVRDKVNKIIDDFIVYKQNGDSSIL